MSQVMKYVWVAAALLAAFVIGESTASARGPVRFARRVAVRSAVVATPPYRRVYVEPAPIYVVPRVYLAPVYEPVIYSRPVIYLP